MAGCQVGGEAAFGGKWELQEFLLELNNVLLDPDLKLDHGLLNDLFSRKDLVHLSLILTKVLQKCLQVPI